MLSFRNVPVKIFFSGQALPLHKKGSYGLPSSAHLGSLCDCVSSLLEFITNVASLPVDPNQNQFNVTFLVTQQEIDTYQKILYLGDPRN